MPAAAVHRRLLLVLCATLYGTVFACFVFFEAPGLGIAHFFYIPVALLAVTLGLWVGIGGGLVAAGLYALAIVLTPRIPVRDIITSATAIRLVTYCSVGAIIGWFADQHRSHVAQLRLLADRDFLTGLLNTRVFDEALTRRCAAGDPFILLLGDMDNLKAVNDAHGHTEGNRVLRLVGEVLQGSVRTGSDVARVGGDEFAILTAAKLSEATELCTKLRRLLGAHGYDITFGWAAMPEDGVSPLELFRKADDRLFGAKLLHRNRRAVQALTATS